MGGHELLSTQGGEITRQDYERRCLQLQNQDAKGANSQSMDKTRAAVKLLYARIWVALRTMETISKQIQKLKDEELQPQLVELLQGLMRVWKIMAESHKTQRQIMSEVSSFTCPGYGKFCTPSQRFATIELEAELRCWRSRFNAYTAATRDYVEALDSWLSKFVLKNVEYGYGGRANVITPPLIVNTCRDWLTMLRRLPDARASSTMKSFIKDVRILWAMQGEEQQQRRKAERFAKDYDRRVEALHKAETRVLNTNLLEHRPELEVLRHAELLSGKDQLELIRKKTEMEKEKHKERVEETERFTLSRFKKGFGDIFGSLAEFSEVSVKMYCDILKNMEAGEAMPEQPLEKRGSSGLEDSTTVGAEGQRCMGR